MGHFHKQRKTLNFSPEIFPGAFDGAESNGIQIIKIGPDFETLKKNKYINLRKIKNSNLLSNILLNFRNLIDNYDNISFLTIKISSIE